MELSVTKDSVSISSGCHTGAVSTTDGGLRELKKARTKAELQRHALRLFRAQGYAETTVDEIAAAAEVSRSTFFRYFPTKEDVVLFDDVDPLMEAAFAAQDPDTPLLTAFRTALRTAFAQLSGEKRELEEVRMELARTVPELRHALRERTELTVEHMASQIAQTSGRGPADLDVHLFAGVISGARRAAQVLVTRDPGASYIDTLDAVFARLETGIPLAGVPLSQLDPHG